MGFLKICILIFHLLDTPCGQLPVLEYNGVKIAQSMTIARFLAKEFNLAGQSTPTFLASIHMYLCFQ